MKNTLSLYRMPDKGFKAEFHYIDGCSMWELHDMKSDSDILVKYVQKKHFQHLPGNWELLLPNDQKVFADPNFDAVVQMALAFIHHRDNPYEEDGDYFC